MDTMYNIKVPLNKDDFSKFEDVLVNKKTSKAFINKKLNVYGFPDWNLNISCIYGKELSLSLFSGAEFIKETKFYLLSTMEDLLSVLRTDFEYKGQRYFVNFKLELNEFHSDLELVSYNTRELDVLKYNAKNNNTLDLVHSIYFLNLNRVLDIFYSSYLIIAHYFVTKDVSKNLLLREKFINKLETIGINNENNTKTDSQIRRDLQFMVDFAEVNHNNIEAASTLINLLICDNQSYFIEVIEEILKDDLILYKIIANFIKKDPYIHLL